MINYIKKYPVLSKFIFALVLMLMALLLSVIFNCGVVKQYFPFTAPILLVVATYILYKTENKSLKTIGLNLSPRNIYFLLFGLFVGALAFLGARLTRALYVGESIHISPEFDYKDALIALYFILPQVATEELIFRGYLFKKTIEVSNVVIANVIFSILFTLIHVIDTDVLNNLGMVVMLSVTIPVGHLLFATGLIKSKTLFFPIGLHLGNNWATRHFISSGKNESVFFITDSVMFDSWSPFLMMLVLFNSFYVLIAFLIWKWDVILRRFHFKS